MVSIWLSACEVAHSRMARKVAPWTSPPVSCSPAGFTTKKYGVVRFLALAPNHDCADCGPGHQGSLGTIPIMPCAFDSFFQDVATSCVSAL